MLKTLEELCALDGPSGCEDSVRDYIRAKAAPFADEILEDPMGNLMILRRGRASRENPLMLCAHMDEVGVIVKRITDDGMIRFGFVGGIDPRVVIGRKIRFTNGVLGFAGIKAVHLTTAAERENMPKAKDLYIDIGASGQKQAEARLSLGDYGTFDAENRYFGDGLLKAKAIDDRIGCAVLLTLLQTEPPADTWFCFTVQEEVGLRGAATAAFRLNPDFCLVVEGTTAADLAEAPGNKQVCRLRGGAVLPFMDRGTIYDRELFELLRSIAAEKNIRWQTKHMVAGGTDAGRIHKLRTGIRTAGIAVPVRYIHSPVSVAAIQDMEDVLSLTRAFLENFGGQDA